MSAQYWTELTQQGQAMVEGLDILSQTRQARTFDLSWSFVFAQGVLLTKILVPTHSSSSRSDIMPA